MLLWVNLADLKEEKESRLFPELLLFPFALEERLLALLSRLRISSKLFLNSLSNCSSAPNPTPIKELEELIKSIHNLE